MAIEVDLNRIALALESLVEIGADILGKLRGTEAVEQLSASTQQQLPDPVMVELTKLTRVELMERLKERGLKTGGNKAQLISLLWESMRLEKQQDAEERKMSDKESEQKAATEVPLAEESVTTAPGHMAAMEANEAAATQDPGVEYTVLRELAEKHFSIAGKVDLRKWFKKAAPGVEKLTKMTQEQQDRLYEILVVLEWARSQPGLFAVEAQKLNADAKALETQDAIADALTSADWSALFLLVIG